MFIDMVYFYWGQTWKSILKKQAMGKKPMNKPMASKKVNNEKDNIPLSEDKFDPMTEFADDITAYDIQYYHDAIFAQKGSKEELKYPYLLSGYINCCPIDKDIKSLSPIHIAQSYLNKDLLPIYGRKTREYFETILIETGSVEIQHMDLARDYAFSKMIIKKVIPAAKWGLPLGQARQMNTFQAMPNMYNYHDYIKAWDNILIYENSQRKHSWWIKIQLDDINQFLPTWFKTFFYSWGLMPIILPRNVKIIWRKFQQANIQLESLPAILQFAINYNVPWIIKWDYGLQDQAKEKCELKFTPTLLVRKILIKWWGKEDFFAEGKAYDRHGIIAVEPAKEVMKTLNADLPNHASLLKELFQHMDKNTITEMWTEIFGDTSQLSSSQSSTSKGKAKIVEDTEMVDPIQDAQDPYEDDDLFALLNQ